MKAVQSIVLAALASSFVRPMTAGQEVLRQGPGAVTQSVTSGVGEISCRVVLAGEAPPLPRIAVDKSVEHCGAEIVDPVLLVENGAIANAVAFLQFADDQKPHVASVDDYRPSEVQLRDANCLMQARILCARRGDQLVLRNEDQITHNPHGWQPGGKTAFNLALLPGPLAIRRTLKDVGLYRVDCDIHGWMHAYVHVFDHPWYALSGKDGGAHIRAVPPGRYRVVVWHEVLGTKTIEVAVEPDKTTDVEVQFEPVDHRPVALVPAGMRPWIPASPASVPLDGFVRTEH